MDMMIQELTLRVWDNPKFHEAAERVELVWLQHELGVEAGTIQLDEAARLVRAAAILACSEEQSHRNAAFRTATCVYELTDKNAIPIDQALRVVLARLGNFPSFATRAGVDAAQSALPLSLVTEELTEASSREVTINGRRFYFTNFQRDLWKTLSSQSRVALSAPTSAGKSFVLQNYLVSRFATEAPLSVVYLVPTRALITQVSSDIATYFRSSGSVAPDVVTVPPDPDRPLPTRAIYVMTQERIQLALASHPDFRAALIVVDEAQSIGDGSRGILLQWILDDLLHRDANAQLLFASPNVRNLGVFGRLFGLKNVREISSSELTVAQNFLVVKINSATKGKITILKASPGTEPATEVARIDLDTTIASRPEKLVHIAGKLGRQHANIVYANGAADAEDLAIRLTELFSDREPTEERIALADLAKEVVHPNYVLVNCIQRGVAFHYSNIPTQLRRAIEDAVSAGHVDYLVCTSTLLQGVNLPVRNIFMCLPEKGRLHPLESADFWNLSGRAGRLRREFHGNIFLIDYAKWKVKPLDGPAEADIVPAIEATIREHEQQLVTVITNQRVGRGRDDAALETAFVRLYTDHKKGALSNTLSRSGITDQTSGNTLAEALEVADRDITLPTDVIRLSPNISAHKQQKLFNALLGQIAIGRESAEALVPKHPRESDAFNSYANALEFCHQAILEIDTLRKLHRFHALMALRWMRGISLPQIIDEQIKRSPEKNRRTVIRDTLELIETQIRFQCVRLFGCYNALLIHALKETSNQDLVASIPSIPVYLEVGASDRTMISFIALGLSRVTAMKLNEASLRKDLDEAGALQWLRTRTLDHLALSPLLLEEVRTIISANES